MQNMLVIYTTCSFEHDISCYSCSRGPKVGPLATPTRVLRISLNEREGLQKLGKKQARDKYVNTLRAGLYLIIATMTFPKAAKSEES